MSLSSLFPRPTRARPFVLGGVSDGAAIARAAWSRIWLVLAAGLSGALLAPVLGAAVLVGGYEVYLALQSPGEVIRRDLTRAAPRVASLPWSMPRERVQQTVSRYFPGYRTSVDATGFPGSVSVTLHDLDFNACRDAYRKAARIEGMVVIAIAEGDDRACRNGAAITWRIMP